MKYVIKFSENHPFSYMRGEVLELFPVSRTKEGWVRDDENGSGWGYMHPIEKKAKYLPSAGTTADGPRTGFIHPSYQILGDWEEYRTLDDFIDELGIDLNGDKVEFFSGLTIDNSPTMKALMEAGEKKEETDGEEE